MPWLRAQALWLLTSLPLCAGCGTPLRAPSASTSPSPGRRWSLESPSSPMGASLARRPPRSQVRKEQEVSPLCQSLRNRPLVQQPLAPHSIQMVRPGASCLPTHPPEKGVPRDGTHAPPQHSERTRVFCLQAASSSFRSSDKPIRTPSRSMRECPPALVYNNAFQSVLGRSC